MEKLGLTLQERLSDLAQEHGVVGAVAAVRRGDAVVEAATGVTNMRTGVEVTTDTVFQIGSISKVYTATLVMQLVDEALVALDAPVTEYLPELTLADPEAARQVTVRQLLCHTAGIDGDVFDDFGRGDDCIESYVAAMSALGLTQPPGAFFSYCNAGFVLLGRLVERVRRMPWDQALSTHLVAPLGLTDTVTLPEEAIMRRAAIGHVVTGDNGSPQVAPVWHLSRALSPAGAITARATDVLSFAGMHLDDGRARTGEQVLSPGSAKAMRELQVEMLDPDVIGRGFGLGWILYSLDSPAVIGHDGGTIGQYAYLRAVPEHDFSVVLLTNGGGTGTLFNALVRPLLEEETGAELREPPVPPAAAVEVDPTPFLGVYERSASRIEIARADEDDQLILRTAVTGALAGTLPDEPPRPLRVLDETRLITAEPDPRLGQHITVKFFGERTHGFEYLHMGGRATPRTSPARSDEHS
jgi:CubicO group peptidase (beta-lactamase class C family)